VGEESDDEMKLYAIAGLEQQHQSQHMYQLMYHLCRQEIEMRCSPLDDYHHQQQNQNQTRNQEIWPLAQIHSSSKEKEKEQTNGQRLVNTPSDLGNHHHPYKRTTIVSTDSTGEGMVPEKQPPPPEYLVDSHRVSVFIDPLDGTKAYAKGDYQPVSILIAIILDRTPCFGVICKPFGYPGQSSVLDTGCVAIYGGTLLGGAYTAGASSLGTNNNRASSTVLPAIPIPISSLDSPATAATTCTDHNHNPLHPKEDSIQNIHSISDSSPTCIPPAMNDDDDEDDDLPRAVISSGRSKGIVGDFVSFLGSKGMIHPKPLLVTGAGEKSLRIIVRSNKEGLWFFPKPGTSLWDVAAADALLRATGGRLTDKNGKDMDYTKSRTEAENDNGVVACYDEQLHAECIRLFLESSWQE
jgi:3'-phosphoadenosine 5'-phosphosulfate (PAPS) 3'-phosphatase